MTTWILLRGLARESAHWGGFLSCLQAALGEQDRVIAIDLPRTDEHHDEASPTNIAATAAACRADAMGRGLQGPFVLVALSLGAMVALQWERGFRGEVAGCVLINTSLSGYSPFWRRLQPANYPRIVSLLWPGLTTLDRERRILSMTSSAPHRHPGIAGQWALIARRNPVSRANVARQLLAAARCRAGPSAPVAPVLLLGSMGDTLVSPQCTRDIAARWSITPAMHPSAGHDLPLDDAPWVVRRILEWRQALS